ncbi:HNH endonuclease [Microbacterium sp. LRZ72]|uniref:HNH endonuclease signature motif containing protein n=1 Tax=Microbacterium sp. LRZ72 TaxID=2942481 RepID=UPI0029BB11F5|nr:DUF222 domain-containing protein [Microbacterium sp. LRZ72]MDX2377682.1 HNH endonuclease [Microbacterium sp. LRZ72]
MNQLLQTLAEVDAALGAAATATLDAGDVSSMSDDDVLTAMSLAASISRRAEGLLVETANVVDERSRGPVGERATTRAGCRSVNEVLQRAALVGPLLAAGDRAPAGALMAADAALADAARGVRVGADGGDAGEGEAGEGDADAGDGGERGPAASVADLRTIAQMWAAAIDPDGAEPAEAVAMRKRGLTFGAGRDGVVPVRGALLAEVAAQLQRITDAVVNPRGSGAGGPVFREEHQDEYRGEPEDAPADTRTRPQKMHDALATALDVAARSGELPTVAGGAPTLVVYARDEDLEAGTGWAELEGCDEPVSISVATHVGCCGTLQRVGFDAFGRVASLGIRDRVFNHVQRKAISLRDGGCVIPGCGVAAAWCEIHHVEEHAHGGATHCDNGVLLCWFHHRTLGSSGWDVAMFDGVPHVRGPGWWDAQRRWMPGRGSRTRQLAQAGTPPGG